MTEPRRSSLDERVTAYLRVWAAAALAEYNSQDRDALARFIEAACIAPTCADETQSLCRAFACLERVMGPSVPRGRP